MINWKKIETKINSNIRNSLALGSPSFNNQQILDGIELFKKVIFHKLVFSDLNGLPQVLIPALQKIYITDLGDIGSLRIIADSLEPFLKKLCIIGKGQSFQDIQNKTLIPILKNLQINIALTNQVSKSNFPELIEDNLNAFRTEKEYLFEICNSYLVRNKVHVSPDLSELEVLSYLKDLLVVFIYSSLKFKSQIDILPLPSIDSDISDKILNGDENKMLYDFISFGNTTTEIKSQIIDTHILHSLIKIESVVIDELKKSTEEYLKTSFTDNFYKRKIESLRQNKKIEYSDTLRKTIKLSETEKERLCNVQKSFYENKDLFLLFFKDIIDAYNLNQHFNEILEKLTDFFVSNYNVDIKEIYERDIEKPESTILEEFISYLKSLTNDEEIAKKILVDLLKLCEQSDFIIRISASKVLGKLTNPDYFQNYIRNKKRIVYLDTQLVLYALCIGYAKKVNYENIYYQIIEELFSFAEDNPNVELRFSRLYLSEVAYQLKLALLLIPFEDIVMPHFSNNVFYLFYDHLKENKLLEENDDSFAAFLENWLDVKEEDALSYDSDHIISSNISDLIKEHLKINVITLPYYDLRDSAVAVLEDTIKRESLSPKSHHILTNDALMVCHLSNSEEHPSEPFFLTWDKTFTYYRKSFKSFFSRRNIISWHLFNPSKFMNHMSLLDFKIDPKSITNEYLSILDGFGLQEKTRTIFDNMNRFLDIKNISTTQRRKYIKLTTEIFSEKEFSYEINIPEGEVQNRISKSFESVIDKINIHFHDSRSEYSIDLYRKMLLKEDYFIKVIDIVKEQISLDIKENSQIDYLSKISELLKIFEDTIKTQHNIL
jgi:hypothetical protein